MKFEAPSSKSQTSTGERARRSAGILPVSFAASLPRAVRGCGERAAAIVSRAGKRALPGGNP